MSHGIECNLFAEVVLRNDMKFFAVAALFLPGSYFSDVKGKPLSGEQQRYISAVETTGVYAMNRNAEKTMILGTDVGYNLNVGVEYKF